MSGVSKGWSHGAFLEWYTRYLSASGRVRPMARWTQIIFREPGVGVVQLVEDSWRLPLRSRLETMARFHLALVSAHTRVLTVLRRHVASHSTEFVHAALYSGRLGRASDRAERETAWLVSLQPADALSDWILALFAADYMIHPNDYLRGLGVCRICGRVRFHEQPHIRTLCEIHGAAWLALNAGASGRGELAPFSGGFQEKSPGGS